MMCCVFGFTRKTKANSSFYSKFILLQQLTLIQVVKFGEAGVQTHLTGESKSPTSRTWQAMANQPAADRRAATRRRQATERSRRARAPRPQAAPQEAATVCACYRAARRCERTCRCGNMHLQQLVNCSVRSVKPSRRLHCKSSCCRCACTADASPTPSRFPICLGSPGRGHA